MTSAEHREQDLDDQGTAEAGARWQQPLSLTLLATGLILLFATKILGSLSGGPFESVADVGPQPLYALSAVLLVASMGVAYHRR